jgi:hypothetical protein
MDGNSGRIVDLGPPKSDKAERTAWEKENPSGFRWVVLPSVDCYEWVAHGRGRYVGEMEFNLRQQKG